MRMHVISFQHERKSPALAGRPPEENPIPNIHRISPA